ncbi:MAG: glycosyltransferase family 2 protein [Opitutaceae bacterium]
MKITIVMPCLNEAETLKRCIDAAREGIKQTGLEGEILVADNGSTDGSQAIGERNGARVVNVTEKGYGNALRGGIEASTGDFIVMGDADASYDFANIVPFVEEANKGADLVMGCRMPRGGGTIMPGAMPWKNRYIGNPSLSLIGRILFKTPITDFHCGLRGFTKEAYRRMGLSTTGMEFASEMVIKASLQKMKIAEVPVTLHKDGRSRPPHLKPWRDGWRHLRFMLLFSPTWLFLKPGAALTLLGLLFFIPLCFTPIPIGSAYLDTNSLMLFGLLVLVGLQLCSFGIFARTFAVVDGFLPKSERLKFFFSLFNLEKGLTLGALIMLGGLGLIASAFLWWRSVGYGALPYADSIRLVAPGIFLTTAGVQVVFSSFLLSILGIQRKLSSFFNND